MLAVVLHLTLELLKGGPPDDRDSTLGGVLANTLLKVQFALPHNNCGWVGRIVGLKCNVVFF